MTTHIQQWYSSIISGRIGVPFLYLKKIADSDYSERNVPYKQLVEVFSQGKYNTRGSICKDPLPSPFAQQPCCFYNFNCVMYLWDSNGTVQCVNRFQREREITQWVFCMDYLKIRNTSCSVRFVVASEPNYDRTYTTYVFIFLFGGNPRRKPIMWAIYYTYIK